jgi:hypothetical protein
MNDRPPRCDCAALLTPAEEEGGRCGRCKERDAQAVALTPVPEAGPVPVSQPADYVRQCVGCGTFIWIAETHWGQVAFCCACWHPGLPCPGFEAQPRINLDRGWSGMGRVPTALDPPNAMRRQRTR